MGLHATLEGEGEMGCPRPLGGEKAGCGGGGCREGVPGVGVLRGVLEAGAGGGAGDGSGGGGGPGVQLVLNRSLRDAGGVGLGSPGPAPANGCARSAPGGTERAMAREASARGERSEPRGRPGSRAQRRCRPTGGGAAAARSEVSRPIDSESRV